MKVVDRGFNRVLRVTGGGEGVRMEKGGGVGVWIEG